MAILAGDALLTRAFGVLAEADSGPTALLCGELAGAAGPSGMIAGQVADMDLCPLPAGLEGLEYIHLRKTAALIRSAVRMGALAAGADAATLSALSNYGRSLGLAFQLIDDLLDVLGESQKMGKATGKDAQAGKKTHAAQIGLDGARQLGERLTSAARSALEPLGPSLQPLRLLAQLLAERTH